MAPENELEAYGSLLIDHLRLMHKRMSLLKAEHWDWSPNPAAPAPRTLAVHAWQWLQCDRQHIENADFRTHKEVAEPPEDLTAFCDAFSQETDAWEALLQRLTPEDLVQRRGQFSNDGELNVRWFIAHMIQNVIYKHGQFSEVYFALGYDGMEPYSAPFPNAIYAEVRDDLRSS